MSGENRFLLRCYNTFPFYHRFILCHDCKRLGRTSFQCPQALNRFFIRRIAAQMKTTDSFDCYNLAITDHPPRTSNGIPSPFGSADQIDFRSTFITAHRLGVITPRLLIIILFCTVRAHGKFLHTCPFPVIGQGIQNRQPRTTAGTVDKRMQIPSVFRIVHFFLTFLADGNIWRNKDLPFGLFTFNNVEGLKMGLCLCGNILCINF